MKLKATEISPLTSFGRDGSSWLIPQSISTVEKRSEAEWRNLFIYINQKYINIGLRSLRSLRSVEMGSSWLIPQSISTVAKRSGAKWRNLFIPNSK